MTQDLEKNLANIYSSLQEKGVIKSQNSYEERIGIADLLNTDDPKEPFSKWFSRLDNKSRAEFLYMFGD
jgi:hypothetical protein